MSFNHNVNMFQASNNAVHVNQADAYDRYGVNTPSGGAIGAKSVDPLPLETFFGPKPINDDVLAKDRRYTDHSTLPAAYEGRNMFIANFVKGLVTNNMEFLINEPDGLPKMFTDQKEFWWDEISFDQGFWENEPEEGVARVSQFTSERSTATVIRKAKAIILEHDFKNRPEGHVQFMRQIQQMHCNLINSLTFGALLAMLKVHNRDLDWLKKYNQNYMDDGDVGEALLYQCEWTGIFNKSAYGPANWIDKVKSMFSTRNVVPKTIIIPMGAGAFFNGLGEENLDYLKAGPEALERRKRDPESIRSVRGMRIRYTQQYIQKKYEIPVDPLIRRRIFGSYCKMIGLRGNQLDLSRYKSSDRDILMFDFNANEFRRITLQDALDNCGVFDANGYINPVSAGEEMFPNGPNTTLNDIFQFLPDELITFYSNTPIGASTVKGSKKYAADENLTELKDENLGGFGRMFSTRSTKKREDVEEPSLVQKTTAALKQAVGIKMDLTEYEQMYYKEGDSTLNPNLVTNLTNDKNAYDLLVAKKGDVDEDVKEGAARYLHFILNLNGKVGNKKTWPAAHGIKFGTIEKFVNDLILSKTDAKGNARKAGVKYGLTIESNLKPEDFNSLHENNLKILSDPTKVEPSVRAVDLYSNFINSFDASQELEKNAFLVNAQMILEGENIQSNLIDKLKSLQSKVASKDEILERKQLLASLTDPSNLEKRTYVDDNLDNEKILNEIKKNGSDYLTQFLSNDNDNINSFHIDPISGNLKQGGKEYLINNDNIKQVCRDIKLDFPTIQLDMNQLQKQLDTYAYQPPNTYSSAIITYDLLKGMIQNNIPFPFNFIIVRKDQQWYTATAIVGKMGSGTGFTAVSNPDVMFGDHVTDKTHEMHAHCYAASVVTTSTNIHIASDLIFRKYLGGGNNTFIREDEWSEMVNRGFAPNAMYNAPSIYPLMIPYLLSDLPAAMDARGYFIDENERHFISTTASPFYKDLRTAPSQPVWSTADEKDVNTHIVQQTQKIANPNDNMRLTAPILGKDWFGNNLYNGVRSDIEAGRLMKEQNYERLAVATY